MPMKTILPARTPRETSERVHDFANEVRGIGSEGKILNVWSLHGTAYAHAPEVVPSNLR